jgi:hypothetical protein
VIFIDWYFTGRDSKNGYKPDQQQHSDFAIFQW